MGQTLLAWLCLIGAGICQMGWTYSLKFIKVINPQSFQWFDFSKETQNVIGPWVGYIIFGAVNSILLSIAMRAIPTATAFIVWMGLSLLFIKLGDRLWFKIDWSFAELFFTGVILIGIVGLKASS